MWIEFSTEGIYSYAGLRETLLILRNMGHTEVGMYNTFENDETVLEMLKEYHMTAYFAPENYKDEREIVIMPLGGTDVTLQKIMMERVSEEISLYAPSPKVTPDYKEGVRNMLGGNRKWGTRNRY